MKRRERVRASAPLRPRKARGDARADVPAVVRDTLGGRAGDTLVFEEGCDAAVQRAVLSGPYFVVRLERAEPRQEAAAESGAEESQAAVGSLAEAVQVRLKAGSSSGLRREASRERA